MLNPTGSRSTRTVVPDEPLALALSVTLSITVYVPAARKRRVAETMPGAEVLTLVGAPVPQFTAYTHGPWLAPGLNQPSRW